VLYRHSQIRGAFPHANQTLSPNSSRGMRLSISLARRNRERTTGRDKFNRLAIVHLLSSLSSLSR
jgi:hypothetical protein